MKQEYKKEQSINIMIIIDINIPIFKYRVLRLLFNSLFLYLLTFLIIFDLYK